MVPAAVIFDSPAIDIAAHAGGWQYHLSIRGLDMRAWCLASCVAVAIAAHGAVCAQQAAGAGTPPAAGSVALFDSSGKAVARPLTDTVVLIALGGGLVAPASIRPVFDPDGRTTSGTATWQSGGTVLFSSSDCTTGANVYSLPVVGVRAAAQVSTPAGIVLYVGAIGSTTTVEIHSILYDTGCAPVAVRQNGLLPVLATVNLSTAYPPPLSFQ